MKSDHSSCAIARQQLRTGNVEALAELRAAVGGVDCKADAVCYQCHCEVLRHAVQAATLLHLLCMTTVCYVYTSAVMLRLQTRFAGQAATHTRTSH